MTHFAVEQVRGHRDSAQPSRILTRTLPATLLLTALAVCCLLTSGKGSADEREGPVAEVSSLPAAAKYALVVGISQYDASRGLNPLRYSDDDARDFARLLENRLGFPHANIRLFEDGNGAEPAALPTYEHLEEAK